jgi:hypothetical protein
MEEKQEGITFLHMVVSPYPKPFPSNKERASYFLLFTHSGQSE